VHVDFVSSVGWRLPSTTGTRRAGLENIVANRLASIAVISNSFSIWPIRIETRWRASLVSNDLDEFALVKTRQKNKPPGQITEM
jgi:hypothetical protein